MDSAGFFADLASFSDFHRLGESLFYRPLPEDWFVVICDIRGSTKAIEEGRYQEVNTLGAASIAAVQSVWKGEEIPFVFGGDGASFLVPAGRIEAVKNVLVKLRNFAQANYGMELRVGAVQMREVAAQALVIEVAKFAIAEGKSIALMRGGGLTYAENLIKASPDKYCVTGSSMGLLDELAGLSCRWQPLSSKKGAVLSILIKPVSNDPRILDEILRRFERIFEGGLQAAHPANLQIMEYKSLWQCLRTESRYSRSLFSRAFMGRLVSILISVWAFRFKGPVPFKAAEYVSQMPSHSDYRKFDDMLRMILDCSSAQIEEITGYLKSLHEQKLICYGLHQAPHALMTCLVETLQQGGHIHFIDGGDGGYAIAAKHLKDQLAKL